MRRVSILYERELFEVPEEEGELFIGEHQAFEIIAKGDRPVGVHKALSELKILRVLLLLKEQIELIENELVDQSPPGLANCSAPDRVQCWQMVQNFQQNMAR